MKRVMPHASLAIVASIACSGPPFAAASAPSPEGGTEGGSSDASVPDASLSCAAFPCVIASGLAAPISVVYNGFAGYWADEGTSPNYSDGAIQKYELAGASVSTVAATIAPVSLDVGSSNVHWLSLGGDYVGIIGTDGAARGQANLPPGLPVDLKIDSTSVYVTYVAPAADGGIAGSVIASLALSTIDSTVSTLTTSPLLVPHITLDLTNIYFTTVNEASITTGGSVSVIPKAGGAAHTISSGEPGPYAIAVDGMNAYWTTLAGGTTTGTIRRMPLTAKNQPTVIAETTYAPYAIAVDDTNVYWVEYAESGGVYQVAKVGTQAPVTRLASNQPYTRAISVSDGVVVWVNAGTKTGTSNSSDLFDKKDGQVVATLVAK